MNPCILFVLLGLLWATVLRLQHMCKEESIMKCHCEWLSSATELNGQGWGFFLSLSYSNSYDDLKNNNDNQMTHSR